MKSSETLRDASDWLFRHSSERKLLDLWARWIYGRTEKIMRGISRRFFFWNGAGLGAPFAISPRPKNETVYRFATAEWDVQMTVEFHDRYSRNGFWFCERQANRSFLPFRQRSTK